MIVGDDMKQFQTQGSGLSKSPDHIAARFFLACTRFFKYHVKINQRRTPRTQVYFDDFPKRALPLDLVSEQITTKWALDLLQGKLDLMVAQNKVVRQKFGVRIFYGSLGAGGIFYLFLIEGRGNFISNS